jgi:hypothetical protein
VLVGIRVEPGDPARLAALDDLVGEREVGEIRYSCPCASGRSDVVYSSRPTSRSPITREIAHALASSSSTASRQAVRSSPLMVVSASIAAALRSNESAVTAGDYG